MAGLTVNPDDTMRCANERTTRKGKRSTRPPAPCKIIRIIGGREAHVATATWRRDGNLVVDHHRSK
jgi:hypothetical protein